MRVLMAILFLVAMPFASSAAQGRSAEAENNRKDPCTLPEGGIRRGAPAEVRARALSRSAPSNGKSEEGLTRDNSVKCAVEEPVPPPPPPPPPSDEEPTGSEISGSAFEDLDMSFTWSTGETGLEGWTITLSGPVSGSTVTDASGAYSFVGLPAGTYLVCEVPQIGWWQTVPMDGAECSSGMPGYTRVLSDTPTRFIGNDFGNWLIQ